MYKIATSSLMKSLVIVAAAGLWAGCGDQEAVAPHQQSISARTITAEQATEQHVVSAQTTIVAQSGRLSGLEAIRTIATLLAVTARYHDLNVAKAEGFVFLHGCEDRPGEGPVGTVYVNPSRLMDGKIDPTKPDALIYEEGRNGRMKLAGVEMAIPYSLWNSSSPPEFLGATFQREDEFGVFGLHVWIWTINPAGLFALSNPRVTCDEEEEE
jgi:hypothetical protein